MSFISFHVHDQISVVMISNIVKDWSCLLTFSSTSSLVLIRVPPLWYWDFMSPFVCATFESARHVRWRCISWVASLPFSFSFRNWCHRSMPRSFLEFLTIFPFLYHHESYSQWCGQGELTLSSSVSPFAVEDFAFPFPKWVSRVIEKSYDHTHLGSERSAYFLDSANATSSILSVFWTTN